MIKRRAKITALGTYVPPRVVTNHDLEKMVETDHDWIVARTGIHERHWVEPGTPSSELGAQAAIAALKQRGIEPDEIELIIVSTVTPDMFFPSTACVIQNKIRATRAWGRFRQAAVSSFAFVEASLPMLLLFEFLFFVELSELFESMVLVFVELSALLMFLLLLLLESLVELLDELSCLTCVASLMFGPLPWVDVAVAVCVPPEPSAAPLLVGFAQAVPAMPKARPIADASSVLFMDRSSGG